MRAAAVTDHVKERSHKRSVAYPDRAALTLNESRCIRLVAADHLDLNSMVNTRPRSI
jgi:hypothetical protein